VTAEIVILNKQAVALAADSAVTFGEGQKVFISANKIFTLSKYHPVGIMIFGSAELLDVPWEVIIKLYRQQLGKIHYAELGQYADDFFRFLSQHSELFPERVQRRYFTTVVRAYYEILLNEIFDHLKVFSDSGGVLDSDVIERTVHEVVVEHHRKWASYPLFSGADEDYITATAGVYHEVAENVIDECFEKLPLGKEERDMLLQISISVFTRESDEVDPPGVSGVVVAGFGERENFPVLRAYDVMGVLNGRAVHNTRLEYKITHDDSAAIIPFAQHEMVRRFMEGIDPIYADRLETDMRELIAGIPKVLVDSVPGLSDEQKTVVAAELASVLMPKVEEYMEQLTVYRRSNFVSPITSVAALLPKAELAQMAESLVSITSIKRRVSLEAETVGGPMKQKR